MPSLIVHLLKPFGPWLKLIAYFMPNLFIFKGGSSIWIDSSWSLVGHHWNSKHNSQFWLALPRISSTRHKCCNCGKKCKSAHTKLNLPFLWTNVLILIFKGYHWRFQDGTVCDKCWREWRQCWWIWERANIHQTFDKSAGH